MKLSTLSSETLKTVKCLSYTLFNMVIIDLCLLRLFYILLKIFLKSVVKVLLFQVALTNHKISEKIDG